MMIQYKSIVWYLALLYSVFGRMLETGDTHRKKKKNNMEVTDHQP